MRTDVKLGLIGSLVVVVVAGWYFAGQDKSEPAIPIQGKDPSSVPSAPMLSGITHEESAPEVSDAGMTDPGIETPGEGRTDTAGEPLADLFAAGDDEPGEPFDQEEDQSAAGAAGGEGDGSTATAEGGGLEPKVQTSVADPGAAGRRDRAGTTGRVPASGSGLTLGRGSSGVRMETHTIQPGDTIARLARLYYGDIRYARLLRQANPQVVDPRAMAVGTVIVIPDAGDFDPAAESEAPTTGTQPTAPGQRVYRVQEGDTLYGIADEHLGTGSRWDELYKLNKATIGDDPDALKVGQVLTLPPK